MIHQLHTTLHPVLTWDHSVWSLGRFCKTLWHRFCSTLKKLRFLRPKFSLGLPAKLPNKCNVWYMILQLWVWRSPKVRAPPWPSFAIPLLLHFASLDLPTAARQEGLNTFLTFLRKVALLLLWRWPSYIGVRTAQGQQLNVMAASLRDQNSRSLFHKQRVWKTQLEFFRPKTGADKAGASRRLVSRELAGFAQRTRREFLGLLRFSVPSLCCPWRPPDCVPTANYFVPPLNLSLPLLPQIRGPIARYWTIAWFTTHHHAGSTQNHHRIQLLRSSTSRAQRKILFWTWVDSFSLDTRPETTLSKLVAASLHKNASQLFLVIKRLVWGVGTWFKSMSMKYLGVIFGVKHCQWHSGTEWLLSGHDACYKTKLKMKIQLQYIDKTSDSNIDQTASSNASISKLKLPNIDQTSALESRPICNFIILTKIQLKNIHCRQDVPQH